MSQITRCPSCSTSFKVVADQLRISDGWVRCGQCKEVFDASAHLLPVLAQSLLPGISLTDARPPPAPVVRQADGGREWQAGRVTRDTPVASQTDPKPPAGSGPAMDPAGVSIIQSAGADIADEKMSASDAAPPSQETPGASIALPRAEEFNLDLLVSFPSPSLDSPSDPLVAAPPGDEAYPLSEPFAPHLMVGLEAGDSQEAIPERLPESADARAPEPTFGFETGRLQPAGYELPSADPDASDESLELHPESPSKITTPLPPPQELSSTRSSTAVGSEPAPDDEDEAPVPTLLTGDQKAPQFPNQGHDEPAQQSASFVADGEIPSDSDAPGGDQADQPGMVLGDDGVPEAAERDSVAEQEVSFVVAARRKAFWRKPSVQASLMVVLVATVAALGLQIVVHERDRIAAMDGRFRPWLTELCAVFNCEITPRRQIADVVIDSSSFNKARGDSYQLALTMRSKADIPLALPAVELTLTDAQDQAVLRRVLLPSDMGAPGQLPPRGEWSAALAVVVTTGGARVTGYRLLTFYP